MTPDEWHRLMKQVEFGRISPITCVEIITDEEETQEHAPLETDDSPAEE